jgi:hypothetical protein
MSCLACNESENFSTFTVREFMIGINDQHQYKECSQCGSIQILNPVENLADYYPENYYSLKRKAESSIKLGLTQVSHQKSVVGCVRLHKSCK